MARIDNDNRPSVEMNEIDIGSGTDKLVEWKQSFENLTQTLCLEDNFLNLWGF